MCVPKDAGCTSLPPSELLSKEYRVSYSGLVCSVSCRGLSRRGTMFIPVRRALGFTPPMIGYMAREVALSSPPHYPHKYTPLLGVLPCWCPCRPYVHKHPLWGPRTHVSRVAVGTMPYV